MHMISSYAWVASLGNHINIFKALEKDIDDIWLHKLDFKFAMPNDSTFIHGDNRMCILQFGMANDSTFIHGDNRMCILQFGLLSV